MNEHTPGLKKMLMNKAALTRTPLSGTFELTPRCNLHCRMCYIRMSEQEMAPFGRERTAEEWLALGKTCAEQGMLFLLLTGGEPFLRPDFRTIYSGLKKLGLFLSINSNGTLIDQDTVAWLQKDPPQVINITLYGANNETYHRLCGIPDGFDRVSANIDNLLDHGIAVSLNLSLTRDNIEDLESIVRFGQERNLPMRISNYMFPPLRKKDGNDSPDPVRFSTEECGQARFRTLQAQLPGDVLERFREQFRAGIFNIPTPGECELEGYGMDCMAGRSAFWVTWNGKMFPCGMLPYPETEPFTDGFLTAWDTIVRTVNAISMPAECSHCPAKQICRPCGAMVYAESGNFHTKPDYLCRSTEAYIRHMKG